MELLKSDYPQLVELIFKAKKQVAYCAPNISHEVAMALVDVKKQHAIQVKVFLEFTEKSFRAGFGDIEGFEVLVENAIPVINSLGYNIFCIIVDDIGYFYFVQSRFHEKEGSAYDLFPMEPNQVKRIKLLFGLIDDTTQEFIDLVDDIGIETVEKVLGNLNPISSEECIVITKSIKNDPPLKPDFSRSLETYKAKFQFVELTFHGGNFAVKKIALPSKALPFKDDNLKKSIEATLRLFNDLKSQEFIKPLLKLTVELEKLREKYSFHIKARKKSLIKRDEKTVFETEVLKVEKKIVDEKKDLINSLQIEIAKTRTAIKESLNISLHTNKPIELDGLLEFTLEDEIQNMLEKIMSKIHFPLAKDLLDDMKVKWHFYDITWEDLHNTEILQEMREKKLIDKDEASFISELAISAEKQK
jgi:hypothetical protein